MTYARETLMDSKRVRMCRQSFKTQSMYSNSGANRCAMPMAHDVCWCTCRNPSGLWRINFPMYCHAALAVIEVCGGPETQFARLSLARYIAPSLSLLIFPQLRRNNCVCRSCFTPWTSRRLNACSGCQHTMTRRLLITRFASRPWR